LMLRLQTAKTRAVLAVAVHLPSKLRYTVSTQRRIAADLAEEIRRAERKRNATSFIIGDLNMDPFDPGVIEADALHGVLSRQVAAEESRSVNGKAYPMFYNPMWCHMGDASNPPPGSFYRRTSDNDCIFYHTLEQVLVRPALEPLINANSIRVLTGDGVDMFTSARGIPRKKAFSDHLPIHLDLNL
jgi:hypothetical protein